MATLTKRVQVLLEPAELRRLKKVARDRQTSVGDLMRMAVREKYLGPSEERKKLALARIASMNLPVSDWEDMEREITESYARDEA